MAKSFSNIKSSLGLLDFFTFGKFKNCRVDSLIEDDYEYLIYLESKKIVKFDQPVMDALRKRFTGQADAVNKADDESYEESDRFVPERFEDMPF